MVEINLLPWRSMVRSENAKRRKIFLIFLGALCLLWIGVHVLCGFVMQTYDTTISHLQNELTELTSEIPQNHINPASLVIEQICSNHVELVHFFKILEQEARDIVFLSALTSKENEITITGNADSLISLTHFVRSYNRKNKTLPATILSANHAHADGSLQFHLRLIRSLPPLMRQVKNDDDR